MPGRYGHQPDIQGEDAAFADHGRPVKQVGAEIPDDGGDGRAGSPHPQRGDEDGVQHDVDHRAQNGACHRLPAHPFGPQQVGMDEGQHDDGRARRQPEVVVGGVGKGLVARAQQPDQRGAGGQHHRRDQDARQQGAVKAEGTDPAHALGVLLSQQPGDQAAAALSKNIAQSHQQRKHRHPQRDAGHDIGIAGLRHKIGVGQIVDQSHHHAAHQRHCQFEVGPRHMGVAENRLFILFHIHSSLSCDQYSRTPGIFLCHLSHSRRKEAL